jgi:Mg2+ and Co2+ transporter CorA
MSDMLVKIISHSTTQITERIDNGRTIAEKLTTTGVLLAGVWSLISPLALLTGYYGMDFQKLVPAAGDTLLNSWQVAMPVLLVCTVGLGYVILRLFGQTPIVQHKGT